MFLIKVFLKICREFTGEHPCQSVISIKLLYNFIEIYDVPFAAKYIFWEIARFFRETSHFWDIEMFCFREIMLPLKYAIRTIIAVSED